MRTRTTSSGTSTEIMVQDYMVDNWEEKIRNGGDVLAPEVHQRGGDVQSLFTLKHQMDRDEISIGERRTCEAH
jgi:hypothetical protein